jgi:hypothetical protein
MTSNIAQRGEATVDVMSGHDGFSKLGAAEFHWE